MTRTTDFGSYVKALCKSLANLQDLNTNVPLSCNCDELMLDLDAVTALGIVIAELVANSYEHAFPTGEGTIDVIVRNSPDRAGMAILVVRDSGQGFEVQPGSKRHGLGLVRRLAEQVRGNASVSGTDGAVWTIEFPTTKVEEFAEAAQ